MFRVRDLVNTTTTHLYNSWLRLLGAHIGAGASVNTLSVGAALDLLTVGAVTSVGARSISCHHVPRSGGDGGRPRASQARSSCSAARTMTARGRCKSE